MLKIYDLTCDYVKEPLGIENQELRFGWKSDCKTSEIYCQTSYRIRVSSVEEKIDAPDMWDSGIISSDRSENIKYEGKPFLPCTKYYFKIEVKGIINGKEVKADAISFFETGLYHENFEGKWIAQKNFRQAWAQYLRKDFNVNKKKKVARARAYFCGLGVGELYINGKKIGNEVFDPSITNYDKIVQYRTYDITENITNGKNAVGVHLGDGWYNQRQAWYTCCHYGDCRMILQLHIYYTDGTVEKIVSDESFLTDYSPLTFNNVYAGEIYDARLEQKNWACPDFDTNGWKKACVMDAPGGKLTSILMPPIRVVRSVKPVSVRQSLEGSNNQIFIYDFGENFAGWVKIRIPNSPPGSRYVLRFTENLDKNGNLWFSSTGVAASTTHQQDIYICKGFGEDEYYEPRFTYHGFRYVEVLGIQTFKRTPPEDFIEGFAVNTDFENAGQFSCSYGYVNTLQAMTRRTILSNFHAIPEDCPVREKCGWLGDAQLVSQAAIFNFNMASAYEKYLEDIRTSKESFGTWQMIAPGRRTCGDATPLWGCAQIVIPYTLYKNYNDITVLEKYYDNMLAWVRHELDRSKGYIINEGLGDWCPPRPEATKADPAAERKRIPVEVSSTAEFYKCAVTMEEVADILGKKSDAKEMHKLSEKIKKAFIKKYYNESRSSFGTQGADGVALRYGLFPNGCGKRLANNYAKMIEKDDFAMYTGIYANKHGIPAMTEYGFGDLMLKMLFADRHLNFKSMIDDGATSLWESFELASEAKTLASLNHPMQGAFTAWFYSHILGINTSDDKPGYKKIIFKPYIFDGINHAKGYYDSIYGKISVEWKCKGKNLLYKAEIPANTDFEFEMPAVNGFLKSSVKITRNGRKITVEASRK